MPCIISTYQIDHSGSRGDVNLITIITMVSVLSNADSKKVKQAMIRDWGNQKEIPTPKTEVEKQN